MKKVVLISIFGILTLFVFFVIIRVLIYANSIDPTFEQVDLDKPESYEMKDFGSKWAKDLAQVKQREHSSVVNDLYISSNLVKVVLDSQRVYQLSIDKADRYSLFCIDRILKTKEVNYSLTKDSKQTKLYVISKDRSKLKTIVEELKNYEINSKIKEVTKI